MSSCDIFLPLLLCVFSPDWPCSPTLWSVLTLCITLCSWRGCAFFVFCFLTAQLVKSISTECESHTFWLFSDSVLTVSVICRVDFKNKTKFKTSDLCVLSVCFLDATCGGRTGGCWVSSWIGIIMHCSWRSPAAWSACRWAAVPTTAIARSESPGSQCWGGTSLWRHN